MIGDGFKDKKKSVWYVIGVQTKKSIGDGFELIYKDLEKSYDLVYLMSTGIELAYSHSLK